MEYFKTDICLKTKNYSTKKNRKNKIKFFI